MATRTDRRLRRFNAVSRSTLYETPFGKFSKYARALGNRTRDFRPPIVISVQSRNSFPRFCDGVVYECFCKTTRDIVIKQNQHSLEAVRIETVGSEVEHSFDFLAGDWILFNDFVNGHSVFEIFENESYRRSRIAERPRTAHFAGRAFDCWTLRPIKS